MSNYNGMKKASDWVGKKIITTRPMKNGVAELPSGTLGEVTGCTRGKLHLKLNACDCCKLKLYISGVDYFSVAQATQQ